MADEHKYWNTSLDVVSKQCGVAVFSAAAAAYVSSQPCKECWLRIKSGNSAYIAIDATATATNGFPLTGNSALNMHDLGPLPISNLSMLNIFPVAACTVFIFWRS